MPCKCHFAPVPSLSLSLYPSLFQLLSSLSFSTNYIQSSVSLSISWTFSSLFLSTSLSPSFRVLLLSPNPLYLLSLTGAPCRREETPVPSVPWPLGPAAPWVHHCGTCVYKYVLFSKLTYHILWPPLLLYPFFIFSSLLFHLFPFLSQFLSPQNCNLIFPPVSDRSIESTYVRTLFL